MSMDAVIPLEQPIKTIDSNVGSKFQIGEKAFLYNIGMQFPLISPLQIKGVMEHDDGVYYTEDKFKWIREEYLYKSRSAAYRSLIKQAENEMNTPESIVKN